MMEIPFHGSMNACHHLMSVNACHHLMSDLASIFMRIIERCFFFASVSNDISRPMKDRPGFTTLQAWFKWPSDDSSCSLKQNFLNCHSMSMSFSLWSFSCGRRSSRVAESISMPKNVKHVIGPAVLWEARGIPNSVHVWNIIDKLLEH